MQNIIWIGIGGAVGMALLNVGATILVGLAAGIAGVETVRRLAG